MRRIEKLLSYTTTFLGAASSLSFVVSYFIFEALRPKMIQFETITVAEENLMNLVGIGLLFFLAFCLLSLFQIVKYLKNTKETPLFYLVLLASGILSLLFVFGDVALLNDIGKQYKYGLSQPEWIILYILMAFQFFSALALTNTNLFKLKVGGKVKYVARDSNTFMIVQYVGTICGLMGLSFTSLGLLFPRSSLWILKIHTMITALFLLIPYVLLVAYWFIIKLQERTKQWYDEKQIQDIGKSSFVTLILSIVIMGILFFLNFNDLNETLSVLWFPFYAFLVLALFSLTNLYYSKKN